MPYPVLPRPSVPVIPITADGPESVPDIYDVFIDGHGYMLARQVDPNLPFRTQRAKYGYSPTFVERTNVQGDFGDNQQAFWSTATQRDWSGGEGQHFFRSADAQSSNRFWRGENLDISAPGSVKLFGATFQGTAAAAAGAAFGTGGNAYYLTTTNLYDVTAAGSITDHGAHGATVSAIGIASLTSDGVNFFISGDSGHIRKWTGAAYSDFSATVAESMCFLDNTLWGANNSTLSYYSTAGVASTAFQWKLADGTSTQIGQGLQIKPFGGQVMVLRPGVKAAPAELWLADTTGANQVAAFPTGFSPFAMEVINGIVFIVGNVQKRNYGYRTELWYYANGNTGRAYASDVYGSTTGNAGAICSYGNGFAFVDAPNKQVMAYDLGSGAVSVISGKSTYPTTSAFTRVWLTPNNSGLTLTADSTSFLVLPLAAAATTGKVLSSQFDFESSLTKLLRGITVDFTAGTDGDGGSVDVAYKLNATDTGPLDTAYTSLATGVTSGNEFTLQTTCQSVSVQVTLNKGTSTNGPVLKRIYVRAVPIQQTFRNDELILDCSGADGKVPVQLRNETSSALTGAEMVTNLRTAITSTTPVSITDRFGTINAVIEANLVEIIEVAPDEYYVRLTFREV